jgi:hypothetical protein
VFVRTVQRHHTAVLHQQTSMMRSLVNTDMRNPIYTNEDNGDKVSRAAVEYSMRTGVKLSNRSTLPERDEILR